MTAIGTFLLPAALDRQPMLVGDLALYGPEPDHDVRVPTIGSTSEVFARVPGHPGEIVSGCVQKVVICHDRLAVAWSGSRIAAQAVLREFDNLDAPDVASVTKIIEEQEDSAETRKLSLLGLLVELDAGRPQPPRQFFADGNRVTFAAGNFFRGGGAERMASMPRGMTGHRKYAPDATAEAISALLGVVGHLMSLERTPLQPLLEYFGGGYEMAVWHDGRIQKIESVVHLFWNTSTVQGKLVFNPFRILRPKYVGRLLVVYAAGTDSFLERGAKRVERYIISPPHQVSPADVPDDPERFGDAPWVCNHFILNDGATLVTSIASGPELPVEIFDRPDGFDVQFTSKFIEDVDRLAALHDPKARRRRRNELKRKRRSRTG